MMLDFTKKLKIKCLKSIVCICLFYVSDGLATTTKVDVQNLETKSDSVGQSYHRSDLKNESDKKQSATPDKIYQDFLQSNPKLMESFSELNKKNGQVDKAIESIKQWEPENKLLEYYKKYFIVKWQTHEQEAAIVSLYKQLKSDKKFIRLRVALISSLLKMNIPKNSKNSDLMIKESRLMIKQLRGSSEGEILESLYLSWLKKNQLHSEICKTEKMKWFTEVTINFKELTEATETCPISFDEFQTRLRRLLFAAKDQQALEEIDLFSKYSHLEEWQKIYLKALYDSNTGDPALAFKSLRNHEVQILNTDFAENYFYISQRAGELSEAERIINLILKKSSTAKKMKEMKFQQGFLFYQIKKYQQAYTVFDSLYQEIKKTKRTSIKKYSKELDQIAWLRAWILYLDGQYQKALAAFEQTQPYANDQARLAYWIADVHLKLNQEGEAVAQFRRLADPIYSQKTFSFYNLLAWLRVDKYKQELKPNEVLKSLALIAKLNKGPYPVASDDLTYSQVMKSYNMFDEDTLETDEGDVQLVNSENSVIENVDTSGVDVESQKDLQVHINWARFLISQNEKELAKWHLYEVEKKITTKKNAEYLAQFYLDHSFYYRSLSLMNRFSNGSKAQLNLKSDLVLWNSLFPEAYKDFVFKYAENRKIDPYLILSIMRAETQYKSDAISPVGAVGLMQFMPYSAKKVSMLTDKDIQTDELFNPEISIDFGAAYLKKLSLELDYQKPLVAAAYNGGPHRVKMWLKNFGTIEFDRFIEHIPFAETRTYVKRVITFRATYDKLYSKTLETEKYKYLLQTVPVKVEGQLSLKEEWDQFKGKLN